MQLKVSRGNYIYNALGNPATEDLDMDGFDITDLGDIIFRESGQAIESDPDGLDLYLGIGDTHEIIIGSTSEYEFSSTGLDMQLNDITDIDDIIFAQSGQEIRSDSSGLGIRLPTGDDLDIIINSILEYTLNATELDLNTNNLKNFGLLEGSTTTNQIVSTAGGWDLKVDTGDSIDFVFNGVINYLMDENRLFCGANYIELLERNDPAAPSTNRGLLYVRDNGSGKSQLVCRFPTGAIQVIVTEP